MSKKSERMKTIIQILQNCNGASIQHLANKLDVSEMTIRRDLDVLHSNKLITLIKGVAIFNSQDTSLYKKEYNLSVENVKHTPEKIKIGQMAASLIKPNDVVIIDSGTTTYFLAKAIPENIPLTVISYNMNILTEIYKKNNCKIICPGGYYHSNIQMFQSPEGISLISRTCANKAFVSAAGISNKLDVTCVEQYEIDTKKSIIKAAMTKVLLVDSTKFDKICPAMFATISDFDIIITDKRSEQKMGALSQTAGNRIAYRIVFVFLSRAIIFILYQIQLEDYLWTHWMQFFKGEVFAVIFPIPFPMRISKHCCAPEWRHRRPSATTTGRLLSSKTKT